MILCKCGTEIKQEQKLCIECFRKSKNLRWIEDNEIVFDIDNREIGFEAINFIGLNLLQAGYNFEIYYAEGQKSPHLHIKNIGFLELQGEDLKKYKEIFIKKYCPTAYLQYADFSLCTKHLVAEENKPHFKYKTIKKLCGVFNSDKLNYAEDDLIKAASEHEQEIKREIIAGSGITAKIVAKISIIELAKRYGLDVQGRKAICPFHTDSKPSLYFEDSRGLFNCFGCNAHGNIIDFIYLLRKNNIQELKNE